MTGIGAANTWFTSDLHFGHQNIIEYCNRPFDSVDDMNEALITNWNETVDPSDEVWVLGDVAMGKISETLPLVGLLNGAKYLVPGNHDRCWQHHKKGQERWTREYREAGFARIVPSDAVKSDMHGKLVLLSHFPYTGDSHDKDRYVEARPKDDGHTPLLHGHIHDEWKQSGRQVNVGVDAWAGKPVHVEELWDLLQKPTPHSVPVEQWRR